MDKVHDPFLLFLCVITMFYYFSQEQSVAVMSLGCVIVWQDWNEIVELAKTHLGL
jgi:hypothetical protein